nr:MAG TPA: hypothetical protein [Caudoviricetes sp.]
MSRSSINEGDVYVNDLEVRLEIMMQVPSYQIGFMPGSDVYRAKFLDGSNDVILLTRDALVKNGYVLEVSDRD